MRGHDRNRNGRSKDAGTSVFPYGAVSCPFLRCALFVSRRAYDCIAFTLVVPLFVAIAVDRLAGGCPLRGFDGLSDVAPPLISTVSVDSILRL